MDNKKGVFQKHQKKVKFQVDSKYSILEIIGEGAYGVVCSAIDTTNGQRVAIKKICGVFDVPSITKRTLRELKILKHFKHDNIISIKEILRPPSNVSEFSDVYVVMDLMGSDLHHIIHSKQDLSSEHVRYFLYQLLRGLKYIHSANIIHRDLKPSNLLINKDCELKIGDFGMARSLAASMSEKKRVMTEYVATRWYRAPELMLSVHQFTKAIDVWSVGCIFAEMLGGEALFPGSNYLNQLQLILSVVGVPSVEFMSTITSERVRSYIGRLPHKSPVSFATLYPNATKDAIELLSNLLVLDPSKRVSVDDALKQPFVEKYHDLDDEPTCRKFDYDIESIPMERDKLRVHILQEIQYYHSKRAKPNLAPIQTDLLKSYKLPTITTSATATTTPVVRFNDTPQNLTGFANQDSKKRKPKAQTQQNQPMKKKPSPSGNDTTLTQQPNQNTANASNELSSQDRELLQRWSKMQKDTKPFIHPIRKHMDELMQLKAECVVPVGGMDTVKGQAIIDRVSSTAGKVAAPLQFTNFVPQQKNGGVALVAEQTVKMPSTVIISTVPPPNVNTTAKTTTTSRNVPVLPAKKGGQTILVPVGSVPMFQLQCAFGGTAPIVIIPNLAQPKVSAPVHIAPKPVQVTNNTNLAYNICANTQPLIAPATSHLSKCITKTSSNAPPTSRTVVDLTKTGYESKESVVIIDRNNKPLTTSGSKILIRIDKPASTLSVATATASSFTAIAPQSSTAISTINQPIPSSNIHFNVSNMDNNIPDSAQSLNFNSDESFNCSQKSDGGLLSGDLLSSRILHSGGSFLSELSLSSAEIDSNRASPTKGVPCPQASPEECAHVIAQVKRLDDEDKKIVSMMEELEECKEHQNVSTSSSSSSSTKTNNSKSMKRTVEAPVEEVVLPCTTVANSNTDNWSIVKNMLVKSIREKQMKKAQEDEQNTTTTTVTASATLYPYNNNLIFSTTNSVISTTGDTTSRLIRTSPVHYVTSSHLHPSKSIAYPPMMTTQQQGGYANPISVDVTEAYTEHTIVRYSPNSSQCGNKPHQKTGQHSVTITDSRVNVSPNRSRLDSQNDSINTSPNRSQQKQSLRRNASQISPNKSSVYENDHDFVEGRNNDLPYNLMQQGIATKYMTTTTSSSTDQDRMNRSSVSPTNQRSINISQTNQAQCHEFNVSPNSSAKFSHQKDPPIASSQVSSERVPNAYVVQSPSGVASGNNNTATNIQTNVPVNMPLGLATNLSSQQQNFQTNMANRQPANLQTNIRESDIQQTNMKQHSNLQPNVTKESRLRSKSPPKLKITNSPTREPYTRNINSESNLNTKMQSNSQTNFQSILQPDSKPNTTDTNSLLQPTTNQANVPLNTPNINMSNFDLSSNTIATPLLSANLGSAFSLNTPGINISNFVLSANDLITTTCSATDTNAALLYTSIASDMPLNTPNINISNFDLSSNTTVTSSAIDSATVTTTTIKSESERYGVSTTSTSYDTSETSNTLTSKISSSSAFNTRYTQSTQSTSTTNRNAFESSQFPLFADYVVKKLNTGSAYQQQAYGKTIPIIKIDDETVLTLRERTGNENLSIRIKNSNFEQKECLEVKMDESADENDFKEDEKKQEEGYAMLSDFTFSGGLTPLLKCSISDVEDAFLTTFVNTPKTPKSGAAGYGLGMDFEDLFSGTTIDLLNPRSSTLQTDTVPPLSASLLNDWLGMSDIDPADFEDLQRELETNSCSLLDSA